LVCSTIYKDGQGVRFLRVAEGTIILVAIELERPSPAVEPRRPSRIAKGLRTRYSELALARIAKGGGLPRDAGLQMMRGQATAHPRRTVSIILPQRGLDLGYTP
jgi:hypothetical protein